MSFIKKFILKINVSESTTCFVTCCRKIIVILDRSQLNCKKIFFSRCSTYYECNMIRRTCCCSKTLHLLNKEWQKSSLVLYCSLCHRVEVCLVCRTTTFGNHDETIFCTFCCFDINLCRKVTLCVYLIIHV